MGTRALVGYLDTDQTPAKLTSTYNHYDGYPSNLGKGLETFYNSDAKAEEIANKILNNSPSAIASAIRSVNANFNDGVNVGDKVMLGWHSDNPSFHRPVIITAIEKSKVFTEIVKYYFKDVENV